jgi:hypothetical protein
LLAAGSKGAAAAAELLLLVLISDIKLSRMPQSFWQSCQLLLLCC